MNDHLTDPLESPEEQGFERKLRPGRISDFIGQEQNIANLRTYIRGARKRGEALDHVLLHGPPGLGKTTVANIIAAEIGAGIHSTSGPILDKKGDLTAILTSLEQGEVLFIDEIHRLKPALEEILYKAMEDAQIDVIIGQGAGARSVAIAIQPFTLVGATTRAGLLTSPLRDRFGITIHLDFYTFDELTTIITRSAVILNIEIEKAAACTIAQRSRGTPRIANRLLRRLRDFAQVEGHGVIDVDITARSFAALNVDEQGFDEIDRKILLSIIEKFAGGPVGIATLSTSVQEERDTIEDVYEPYLIQEGFLQITPRGRIATAKSYQHFNLKGPDRSRKLF
jgi:holliday junction DNA helicase RuvB